MEYVATSGVLGAIRQLPEVEVEQLAALWRDEHRRHFGTRERRFDLPGRASADRHRGPVLVRDVQARLVGHVVEDEGALDVQLSINRNLGNAAPCRTEPPLSHTATDSPGWIAWISTPLASS